MKKSAFVVPSILVVLGISLNVWHFIAAKEAARSNHWTQIRATIDKSVAGTATPIDVEYHYKVGNRDYRSTRVTLGSLSKSDVSSRLQRYQTGRTVLAYVNPADASESVLELGQPPANWSLLTGWSLIYLGIALGIVSWWRATHQRRRSKRVRRPAPPMSRLKPPPSIHRG